MGQQLWRAVSFMVFAMITLPTLEPPSGGPIGVAGRPHGQLRILCPHPGTARLDAETPGLIADMNEGHYFHAAM
jgi:hypothetical protein